LRDPVEHSFLDWIIRKKRVLRLRPEKSEERGAEKNSCNQLADYSRLSHPLRGFSQKAGRQQNDNDSTEEGCLWAHIPHPPGQPAVEALRPYEQRNRDKGEDDQYATDDKNIADMVSGLALPDLVLVRSVHDRPLMHLVHEMLPFVKLGWRRLRRM
jgi:hypothetical protein